MRFIQDVLKLQQSQIQKKAFNTGPVATVWYLLQYQRSNLIIPSSKKRAECLFKKLLILFIIPCIFLLILHCDLLFDDYILHYVE